MSMRLSKNAYYNWLKNKEAVKLETPTDILKKRIRALFKESREIYGSCRIQKMLEREGLNYCRSYVGLLMKEMGLRSILRRKFVVTTDSKHSLPIAKNVLN
jgi:putative transposase